MASLNHAPRDDHMQPINQTVTLKERWEDLEAESRVVVILTSTVSLLLIGLGVFAIVVGSIQDIPNMGTIAYAAILIVSAGFLQYFALDGVFNENKFEVICFLLIAYMLQIRLIYMWVTGMWFDPVDQRTQLSYNVLDWVTLSVTVIVLLLLVPLTIFVKRAWSKFGLRLYHVVGIDKFLLTLYRFYQIFLSALKLDLQFNVIIVLLGGFFLYTTVADATLWFSVAMGVVSIPWGLFANYAIMHESVPAVVVVYIFAVLEPAYIIFKFVVMAVNPLYRSVDMYLFYVMGSLALACRVVLCVFLGRCVRHFEDGLKERVFFKDQHHL